MVSVCLSTSLSRSCQGATRPSIFHPDRKTIRLPCQAGNLTACSQFLLADQICSGFGNAYSLLLSNQPVQFQIWTPVSRNPGSNSNLSPHPVRSRSSVRPSHSDRYLSGRADQNSNRSPCNNWYPSAHTCRTPTSSLSPCDNGRRTQHGPKQSFI